MKLLLTIIDGLGDIKIDKLDKKTPFEYAKTTNIDYIKNKGECGKIFTSVYGYPTDSNICTLNILGADKSCFDIGRSIFEAKALGINVENYELALRFNIVTIDENDKLTSFNAQGLDNKIIEEIVKNIKNYIYKKTYFLGGYKGIFVFRSSYINSKFSFAPHENIGENYNILMNKNMKSSFMVKDIVNKINNLLSRYNSGRAIYKCYPYSAQKNIDIKSFLNMYGAKSAIVAGDKLIRGIGMALCMNVPMVDGATGDFDTNLDNKFEIVKQELIENDFVLLHINATDELSHRKDYVGKYKFIEKIDKIVVNKILDLKYKDLVVLIMGDHSTLCENGEHSKLPTDYFLTTLNKDKININFNKNLTINDIHNMIRSLNKRNDR